MQLMKLIKLKSLLLTFLGVNTVELRGRSASLCRLGTQFVSAAKGCRPTIWYMSVFNSTVLSLGATVLLTTVSSIAVAGDAKSVAQAATKVGEWQSFKIEDIKKLIRLETWRDDRGDNEKTVLNNLAIIQTYFDQRMHDFNQSHDAHKIIKFEWKGTDNDPTGKQYWVFGYRAGNGPRKVSLLTHLDTVAYGSYDWKPFDPRVEDRTYNGKKAPFLIGRGSIDDKGPAIVAFEALTRALDSASNNPHALDGVTLEVLFDTSEETEMSTPHYFHQFPHEKPKLGIVFDAAWCVRAEKGMERPVFTVNSSDVPAPPSTALSIAKLVTSPGPVNMIPSTAVAYITGPAKNLETFATQVMDKYKKYPFDDPKYNRAEIKVGLSKDKKEVFITAFVKGAQHGSAPQENRASGANPVVSLTNFLAFLVDDGTLANNNNGEMTRFIRWAFGTHVFGETHQELLSRYDQVFENGNGTTYALTKLEPIDDGKGIELKVDIRYAIGHQDAGWDGKTEGLLTGHSLFNNVFEKLIQQYNNKKKLVTFTTRNLAAPDIRLPDNANLGQVKKAYQAVMGKECPLLAIGGGTDAKGNLELVAAGALFTDSLAPPVNFHGIGEGAPLIDLENSGKILLNLFQRELQRF